MRQARHRVLALGLAAVVPAQAPPGARARDTPTPPHNIDAAGARSGSCSISSNKA